MRLKCFRKDILELLERKGIKDYIPVSASVYKINEELFSYNKDSDQWFCIRGNYTVSCKATKSGNGRGDVYEIFKYKFKKDECMATVTNVSERTTAKNPQRFWG